MSIEIDLDIIREPGLNSKEHPAELLVIIIKVAVFAFGRAGCDFLMLGVVVWLYSDGFAGFHSGKGTDKACFVRSLLIALPGEFPLIHLSGIQTFKRRTLILNIRFNVGTKGICLLFCEGIKILEQDIFLDKTI